MSTKENSVWANAARRLASALALLALSAGAASAVPSFAEQTGQPCVACHVGSFGPQLTPFGRQFKLEGYTMRAGETFTNPVSAMFLASFVNTATDQPDIPAPHYGVNNNTTIDQIGVFVAGGIGDHFGGFTQWTYDGVGRAVAWDNLDLRVTTHTTSFGSDLLVGVSVNNNPGVQDAWNTLPAWGFPYTDSDLKPSPSAGTVLDGGLAQSVLGVSLFGYWDSTFYAEAAAYFMPGRGFLKSLGTDEEGQDVLTGAAPYFRVAYHKDYGTQEFEVGAFALIADILPGSNTSTGTSDQHRDVGIDGSYQFLGDSSNIYSVNARYTHENEHFAASSVLGNSTNLSDTLDDFRIDGSYYWQNTIGGSIGFFDTTGSADPLLYASNSTLKPDSMGFTFQVDGTFFGQDMNTLDGLFNLRVGIQYTLYTKFDGAGTNYDGMGRNASDNNTVRIFVWTAI